MCHSLCDAAWGEPCWVTLLGRVARIQVCLFLLIQAVVRANKGMYKEKAQIVCSLCHSQCNLHASLFPLSFYTADGI